MLQQPYQQASFPVLLWTHSKTSSTPLSAYSQVLLLSVKTSHRSGRSMKYRQSADNGIHDHKNPKLPPDRPLQYHQSKLLNLFHNTEFLCCQAEGSDRSESYSDRKYISSQSHLHTGMPACEDNPMLPPPGEPYSCHRKSFLSLFQARFHYSFH